MSNWSVEIDPDLIIELADDFKLGPVIDETGLRNLNEDLVAFLNGLKIEVFSREHPPPHFHVIYQGQSNNFDICTGEPLEGDALKKWHRNIKKWHSRNRQKLIEAWNNSRPSDCPVGEVHC